jgi:hypothetical protein
MTDEQTMVEPTEEEVQQALERLRKQKAYRKEYQQKKIQKLEDNPELAEAEKAKRKEYFETHKEEIYSKRKDYYEKNKDKIKQYHKNYHDKQNAVMKALRARAKEAGMKLEEYLESIA